MRGDELLPVGPIEVYNVAGNRKLSIYKFHFINGFREMNSVHKSKDCIWSHLHCSAYIGTDVKTKTYLSQLEQWQSFKHASRATCLTGQGATIHAPRF